MKKIEMEQKFLFNYIPYNELKFNQKTTVFRKYLSFSPEIRINKRIFDEEERYHMTIKQDKFFKREKIKLRLSAEEYNEISNSIPYPELVMDIYDFIYDDKHMINFKICRDIDIAFVEIEYINEEDFIRLSPEIQKNAFIGTNVTWEKMYYSKNIWQSICNRGKTFINQEM